MTMSVSNIKQRLSWLVNEPENGERKLVLYAQHGMDSTLWIYAIKKEKMVNVEIAHTFNKAPSFDVMGSTVQPVECVSATFMVRDDKDTLQISSVLQKEFGIQTGQILRKEMLLALF